MFNSWGVGKAGVDNGVLVVVAFDDRAMRIEVGDGLSARLPDGQAREIVGGTMLPAFRSGDYRYGVLAGLDAVRTALGYQLTDLNRMTAIPEDAGYDVPSPSSAAPNYSYSRDSAADSSESSNDTVFWALIIAAAVGIALLSWLFKGGGGETTTDPVVPGRRRRNVPIFQFAVVVQSSVVEFVAAVRFRRRSVFRRRRQRPLVEAGRQWSCGT